MDLGASVSKLPPTFTAADAVRANISSGDLARLRSAGRIEELSRGVYRRADAPESAYLDLLAVCARVPRGVVCGESALAIHGLIDDIPSKVHIAVPRGAHRPRIAYPPTAITQYVAPTFTLGVTRFEAAPGEMIPVYGPARSVVDAMRARGRMGDTLPLSALGRYLRLQGPAGVRELQDIARALGALNAIRPSLEAMLA